MVRAVGSSSLLVHPSETRFELKILREIEVFLVLLLAYKLLSFKQRSITIVNKNSIN